MTERTLDQLKADMLRYMKDPHTVPEIVTAMGENPRLISNLMSDFAQQKLVFIAHGTNGRGWTSRHEGGEQ